MVVDLTAVEPIPAPPPELAATEYVPFTIKRD
jgi:hypothetical protein